MKTMQCIQFGILFLIMLFVFIPIIQEISSEADQEKHKFISVKYTLQLYKVALEKYFNDHGTYPKHEEGLAILVKHGYIKKLTSDPWGNEYVYSYVDGIINISSYGADGKVGGSNYNVDTQIEISNHNPTR